MLFRSERKVMSNLDSILKSRDITLPTKVRLVKDGPLSKKVMSLLFNMLSKFVIALLPRSKFLLISWLQSPSAVILEPRIIKSVTVSIVSPPICHEVMGMDDMIFVFEC